LQTAQDILDGELAALLDRDLKGLKTVAEEFELPEKESDDRATLVSSITEFFKAMNAKESIHDSECSEKFVSIVIRNNIVSFFKF